MKNILYGYPVPADDVSVRGNNWVDCTFCITNNILLVILLICYLLLIVIYLKFYGFKLSVLKRPRLLHFIITFTYICSLLILNIVDFVTLSQLWYYFVQFFGFSIKYAVLISLAMFFIKKSAKLFSKCEVDN